MPWLHSLRQFPYYTVNDPKEILQQFRFAFLSTPFFFFFNSILIQFQIQLASDPWLHFLSLAPNLICCMAFELRCFDILKLPETLAEYSTGVISALLFLMQIFWICVTHVPCSHNSRFFGLTLTLLTNGKSFINLIYFFSGIYYHPKSFCPMSRVKGILLFLYHLLHAFYPPTTM